MNHDTLSRDTTIRAGWVGTVGYVDPAYAASRKYTAASDVFSYGVVLFQLLTGKPAVTSEDDEPLYAMMKRVFRRDPNATTAVNYADPKSGYWPLSVASKVAMMGLDCTFEDVKERPTMKQVVQQLEGIVATEFAKSPEVPTKSESAEMCCVCMSQPVGECV
eukprot:TRINITY_DN1381_c0_g1_i10.p1 TRINITY_DN1381_c0_g1~~TRINITY_DN1381_c0_g1_i10.p1  ORF type:complete len:169 (-),score=34.05 TRINITY_DN1381_c0_g1_i10:212-697(-)